MWVRKEEQRFIHDAGGQGMAISNAREQEGIIAEANITCMDRQMVNGRDIPLPDPEAQGRPHTVLGGATSSKTGVDYRQSATFGGGTWPSANGYDVPLYETHWYNHGRGDHAIPHKHIFYYDSSDGGW